MIDRLLLKYLLRPYWRLTRSHTLGVQAVVVDDAGRVLLVRHTYVRGWHLPGGGVERGESVHQALVRELREEAQVELQGKPTLLGVFANFTRAPRDHIAVFVVRQWHRLGTPVRSLEILDQGFFDPDSLPPGTITGVQARLEEVFKGKPLSENW
jgi:ADP-ribose pyrophosphatase YjhB (NUDIX family)